jgi:hypothetical protein
MKRSGSSKSKRKYRNEPCYRDGWYFPSRKEADYYEQLKLWKKAGIVKYFLRQVPFHLPGHIIYRVDFMVVWKTGVIDYVDVKGYETHEFKLKKALVEDTYPIRIVTV